MLNHQQLAQVTAQQAAAVSTAQRGSVSEPACGTGGFPFRSGLSQKRLFNYCAADSKQQDPRAYEPTLMTCVSAGSLLALSAGSATWKGRVVHGARARDLPGVCYLPALVIAKEEGV